MSSLWSRAYMKRINPFPQTCYRVKLIQEGKPKLLSSYQKVNGTAMIYVFPDIYMLKHSISAPHSFSKKLCREGSSWRKLEAEARQEEVSPAWLAASKQTAYVSEQESPACSKCDRPPQGLERLSISCLSLLRSWGAHPVTLSVLFDPINNHLIPILLKNSWPKFRAFKWQNPGSFWNRHC